MMSLMSRLKQAVLSVVARQNCHSLPQQSNRSHIMFMNCQYQTKHTTMGGKAYLNFVKENENEGVKLADNNSSNSNS